MLKGNASKALLTLRPLTVLWGQSYFLIQASQERNLQEISENFEMCSCCWGRGGRGEGHRTGAKLLMEKSGSKRWLPDQLPYSEAQRACCSGKATITRARGVLLMDHTWSVAERAGSQSSLSPVQWDFLEGQEDLSRKRLDKCPEGCPEEEERITFQECRARNEDAKPKPRRCRVQETQRFRKVPKEKVPSLYHLPGSEHKQPGDHGTRSLP